MSPPPHNPHRLVDIAYHLIGDDPEPEDGWLVFDEDGERVYSPKQLEAKRKAEAEAASLQATGAETHAAK